MGNCVNECLNRSEDGELNMDVNVAQTDYVNESKVRSKAQNKEQTRNPFILMEDENQEVTNDLLVEDFDENNQEGQENASIQEIDTKDNYVENMDIDDQIIEDNASEEFVMIHTQKDIKQGAKKGESVKLQSLTNVEFNKSRKFKKVDAIIIVPAVLENQDNNQQREEVAVIINQDELENNEEVEEVFEGNHVENVVATKKYGDNYCAVQTDDINNNEIEEELRDNVADIALENNHDNSKEFFLFYKFIFLNIFI